MEFLLINYEYPPIGAGAANATHQIAKALARQGHTVKILTSRYRDRKGVAAENRIVVVRCHARRQHAGHSNVFEMASFLWTAAWTLPKLLRRQAPQGIVVFFSFPCGPLGLLGKTLARVPYVISLRGGDVPGNDPTVLRIHRLLRPLRRCILKHSLAVVANSQGLKTLAERADPFPVRIITNGVDTEFFHPHAQPEKAGFSLLFIGRFHNQKNLFFLFDCLARLLQQTARPVTLHMVGAGTLEQELRGHATRLGIDRHIVWHDWMEKKHLRAVYQACDCLVNPSLSEGMPNVVLEAMACGLAVVATDVPGNASVVRNGETGYLVALQPADPLVAALKSLAEDPGLCRRMGEAGRRWVVGDFSWDTVARQYAELFAQTPDPRTGATG